MIGMELSFPARGITEECLKRGFLINYTADKILRFIPPLTVVTKDIDKLVNVLDEVFKEAVNKGTVPVK